jgi:hypothetical protein
MSDKQVRTRNTMVCPLDLALKMKLKPKVKQFKDILHVQNFQQVLIATTKEDLQ